VFCLLDVLAGGLVAQGVGWPGSRRLGRRSRGVAGQSFTESDGFIHVHTTASLGRERHLFGGDGCILIRCSAWSTAV
jgi:hypothetical protein